MVIWSALRPNIFQSGAKFLQNAVAHRSMSDHKVFPYAPSRFQWTKFKDLLHLYLVIGTVPIGLVVLYSNVFVGPATLSEIPEGYEPKHWEYYRNPISRFMARYILNNPQQDYEKYLHHIFEEDEKARLRKLEKEVKAKMAERNDYQAYYYRPVLAKYHRITKEAADYLETIRGD